MAKLTLTPPSPSTADALFASYEARAALAVGEHDWRRDHLGASLIGHTCDRYLWLSFRWALDPKHPGQQLRLFERGDREELWIIEDLRAAGFEVDDIDPATGEQYRVAFGGGHVGGGLDGMVRGIPEAPRTTHVLEVKTHNAKSFARLKKDGVKRSKPEHYAQMQVYMRGKGLERALYIAVCKDDDSIHTERVELDRPFADDLLARAEHIVHSPEPPARKESSEFPPCVYTSQDGTRWPCQYYELCHGAIMPERNCRTCVSCNVRGMEDNADGLMECEMHDKSLNPTEQRAGCAAHLTIPSMVNAAVASVDEAARRIEYQFADGRRVSDGGGA